MRYKITIEQIEEQNFTSREWRQRWSDDVFKTTINPQYRADFPHHAPEKILDQYAYAETPSTKDVTKTIYEQTVDDLNIRSVIGAVNGGITHGQT